MKERIWELDALRGLCVLAMVIVHLVYDLAGFCGSVTMELSPWFVFFMNWGGVIFVLLSGCCVTFSQNSLRRGLLVLGCGALVSAVTLVMVLLGFDEGSVIWFGVLHCLGCCMILWRPLKDQSGKKLVALGVLGVILGLWPRNRIVPFGWLLPLGLYPAGFTTPDFFPLLPYLGFFILGAALGKWLYPEKKSRLPVSWGKGAAAGFLCLCGRHSLMIYLLHQPLIFAALMLSDMF